MPKHGRERSRPSRAAAAAGAAQGSEDGRKAEKQQQVAARYVQLVEFAGDAKCINVSGLINTVPGLTVAQDRSQVMRLAKKLLEENEPEEHTRGPYDGGASTEPPMPSWAEPGVSTPQQLERDMDSLQRRLWRAQKQKLRAVHKVAAAEAGNRRLSGENEELRGALHCVDYELAKEQENLEELRRWVEQNKGGDPEGVEEKVVESVPASIMIETMDENGHTYNFRTRAAAYVHIQAGTSADKFASLVRNTLRAFGVECGRLPSRRTILRMAVELKLVSEVQCAEALLAAPDLSVAHTGDEASKHGGSRLGTMAQLPGDRGSSGGRRLPAHNEYLRPLAAPAPAPRRSPRR
eukprot:COSAG04_NODE_168_length_21684_cov_19.787121_1_plen_350_part_00